MKPTKHATPRFKQRANFGAFVLYLFIALFGLMFFIQLIYNDQYDSENFTQYSFDEIQMWKSRSENDSENDPIDGVWQPVGYTRYRFYVYSAFMEKRTVPSVRVIAATKTRRPDAVVCRLWMPDKRKIFTLKAKVQAIQENWDLEYSATYVLCLLGNSGLRPEETVGAFVSVMAAGAGHPPTNRLIVLDTDPKTGIEDILHVCVKPYHGSYSRDEWLVEWFELNRLLGASHFYMYNHSLSAPVSCVLDHYRHQGLVTLLPWTLPFSSDVEIRTEGQFAAFNDCLYRSMSSAGWLLPIDVDEVVLPREKSDLPSFLSSLRASYKNPRRVPVAFLFRNAFFYIMWEDDEEAPAPLVTARKTRRWATPHIPRNRSKFVVRPRDVLELGNHFIWEHMPGAKSDVVAVEKALLHHYRTWGYQSENDSENYPYDGVWQPVGYTRYRFYVYSAFMEKRRLPSVRVIAATKTRRPDAVVCLLWMSDKKRVFKLKAKVQAIRENWNFEYSAAYVFCLLANSGLKPEETVGAFVSVMAADAEHPPTNRLIVLDTEPKTGIEDILHVCVKPYHGSYSRDEWLVEWFELNRLLGASHFYMYNHSLSAPVSCVLDHYRHQGLVTILPWILPFNSTVEIRTEGQFAAFNDCLYRSMSSAGWLLPIDVDEVVLPRKKRDLPSFLSSLRASYKNPKKAPVAYLFRNAFFYLNWEDDEEAPAPLVTARKTRRWATPHIARNRSKYAVRPRDVLELGNHFIWEHMPGARSETVAVEKALLHHYRVKCEYENNCLVVPSTVDRTAHQWSEDLLQRVTEEKKVISMKCDNFLDNY